MHRFSLKFATHQPAAESIVSTVFDNQKVLALFSKYIISTEDSFVPEKIEVRESKPTGGRLDKDTRRIVVVGKGRLKYKVLKYPAQRPHKTFDEDIPMS